MSGGVIGKVKKKAEKTFTFMIVPHSGEAKYSLSITLSTLKVVAGILLGVAVFIFISAAHFSINYNKMKVSKQELSQKAQDYQKMQQELEYFVKKTQDLEQKMDGLEKLDSDLRSLLKDDPALKKNNMSINVERKRGILSVDRGSVDREKAIENLEKIEEKLPEQEESLKELKDAVIQRSNRIASTPTIWPVDGKITSSFGYRRSPFGKRREFHDGLDIGAPYGTLIKATADGVVSFTGYKTGYGYSVIIDHKNGFETSYCHSSEILVKEGQHVKKNQVIAKVGSSGRSTGPHVHYMVKVNGVLENPKDYLD